MPMLTRDDGERPRLEGAVFDEIVENGYRAATISGICERAGLTREAFDRHFEDFEDAYCQTLSYERYRLLECLLPAFASETTWQAQMRAVSYAMLDFVEGDRRRGRFLFVEVFSAGDRAQLIREEGVEAMAGLIDQGRKELDDENELSRATAEAIAGSIFNQIRAALVADLPDAFELTPHLMFNVVAPYIGTEAALEESKRVPPQAAVAREQTARI
jgi:AcrR family transcriptional regulator